MRKRRARLEPVSAANSETGRDELYFVIGGERVAYRGHPGTPNAGKWIALKEGIIIDDGPEPSEADVRATLSVPDDVPIVDGGELRIFEEPKTRVQ